MRRIQLGIGVLTLLGCLLAPGPAVAQDGSPVWIECGAGMLGELSVTAQSNSSGSLDFVTSAVQGMEYVPRLSQVVQTPGPITISDVMGKVEGTLSLSLQAAPTDEYREYIISVIDRDLTIQLEDLAAEYGWGDPRHAVKTAPDPIEVEITAYFDMNEALNSVFHPEENLNYRGTVDLLPQTGRLRSDEWDAAPGVYAVVVEELALTLPGDGWCEVRPRRDGAAAAYFAIPPPDDDLAAIRGTASTARSVSDEEVAQVVTVGFLGFLVLFVLGAIAMVAVHRREKRKAASAGPPDGGAGTG